MKKKILVAAAALAVVGGSVGVLASDADDNTGSQEPRTVQTAGYLSKDEALEKAFEHAEVSKEEVNVEEVEFDKDDGVPHYEIEFENKQTEYEYDIHAESGKVLDYEIDDHNDHEDKQKAVKEMENSTTSEPASKQPVPKPLSMEEARDIALAHADVNLDAVSMDDAELDEDDGRLTWEFEFNSGNLEIEAEVDAYSGAVIDFEKEYDD